MAEEEIRKTEDNLQISELTGNSRTISLASSYGLRSHRGYREAEPANTALKSSMLKTERIMEKYVADQSAFINHQMKIISSIVRERCSKDSENKKKHEEYKAVMKVGRDIVKHLDRDALLEKERHIDRIRRWQEKLHGDHWRNMKMFISRDRSGSEISRSSVVGYRLSEVDRGEGQIKIERSDSRNGRTKKNIKIIRGYGS